MAYICVRLQTNSEGDVSQELAAKVKKICPDIDLSSGWDSDEDEDEEGNITYSAVFGYGEDDYTDEYGEEIECYKDGDLNPKWEIVVLEQDIEMLEYYIEFYPLSKADEIDFVWINDGSQFGYCPKIEYAQSELIRIEKEYHILVNSAKSVKIWEFPTKTVRILQLLTGNKTVYF